MKFLIVEPSPLPILIPLGPKYSPQDPAFLLDKHIAQLAILLFYIFSFQILRETLRRRSVWTEYLHEFPALSLHFITSRVEF